MTNQFTKETAKEKGRLGGQKSKRKPLDQKVQEFVNQEIKKGTGVTYLDAFFRAMANQAVKGNTQAFKELMDRGFGRSKQTIAISGSLEHDVVDSPLSQFQAIQRKIERLEKQNKKKK